MAGFRFVVYCVPRVAFLGTIMIHCTVACNMRGGGAVYRTERTPPPHYATTTQVGRAGAQSGRIGVWIGLIGLLVLLVLVAAHRAPAVLG